MLKLNSLLGLIPFLLMLIHWVLCKGTLQEEHWELFWFKLLRFFLTNIEHMLASKPQTSLDLPFQFISPTVWCMVIIWNSAYAACFTEFAQPVGNCTDLQYSEYLLWSTDEVLDIPICACLSCIISTCWSCFYS